MRSSALHREVMVRSAALLCALSAVSLAQDCPSGQTGRADAQSRLQELTQTARQAFQHGAYEEAATNFRQALCLAPASGDVYFGLGLAEAAAGRFDRAGKALKQADRLSPHNFPILLSRAQVEASAGKFELSGKVLRQAEQLGDAALEGNRAPIAQLHAQLGAALLQNRKLDLALAELLRAAQAGLHEPAILLMLATLENNLGAYGDAIRDAVGVEASSEATTAQRAAAAAIGGLAFKNQKKNDDAIRLLQRAIELAPGETAYLALAEIYETGEQAADAAKLLEQGAAALPDSEKIAVAFGRSLVNAGENLRAAAFLSGATQKYPANAEAWRWLAQAEASLGKSTKATESLEHLARLQPGYPMIHLMIAQSLLKWEQPDYEEALRLLDRAAQSSPHDPDIPYMRGKIYFSLGRYAEAIKPLQRAIGLAPAIPAPYYQLGQALQKLGRAAEAKEQFERFRYLKTEDP